MLNLTMLTVYIIDVKIDWLIDNERGINVRKAYPHMVILINIMTKMYPQCSWCLRVGSYKLFMLLARACCLVLFLYTYSLVFKF